MANKEINMYYDMASRRFYTNEEEYNLAVQEVENGLDLINSSLNKYLYVRSKSNSSFFNKKQFFWATKLTKLKKLYSLSYEKYFLICCS